MPVDLSSWTLASEGAVEARISKERLVRKIQLGAVRGQKIAGVWMVDRESLREFVAREATSK